MSELKTQPEGCADIRLGGGTVSNQDTKSDTNPQLPPAYLLVCLDTGRLDGYYFYEADARGVMEYRNSLNGRWQMFVPVGKGKQIGKAPFEAARRQVLESFR